MTVLDLNRCEPDSLNGRRSIFSLVASPIVLSFFLAIVTGTTFFISEHSIDTSKNSGENFVENIEEQEAWSAGGNRFRQISFLGCAFIGALSLLFGKTGRFRLNLPVLLVMAYILWAGASIAWSIEPGTTLRRYALVLCCVVGCVGFARFLRVRDAVLAAMLVSVGYLLIGVGAEIFHGAFRPHLGDYRFAGTVHPNIQAAFLAMGCIAAFTCARVKPGARIVFHGIFLLLFLFLVLTKCRSATGAVPVALAVIWAASQPGRNIVIGTLTGLWLVSTVAFICIVTEFNPVTQYSEVLLLGRGEETGSSLTGRIPLWQDLAEYVSLRPLQGYGFKAFWTPRHIYEIAVSQEWVVSEAHSSYIDTTLQLGIPGALLLLLTALSIFFHSVIIYRKTRQPEYLFLVGGVFFCLLRGLTESGLNGATPVTAFIFVALAAHSWNRPGIPTDEGPRRSIESDVPDNLIPS